MASTNQPITLQYVWYTKRGFVLSYYQGLFFKDLFNLFLETSMSILSSDEVKRQGGRGDDSVYLGWGTHKISCRDGLGASTPEQADPNALTVHFNSVPRRQISTPFALFTPCLSSATIRSTPHPAWTRQNKFTQAPTLCLGVRRSKDRIILIWSTQTLPWARKRGWVGVRKGKSAARKTQVKATFRVSSRFVTKVSGHLGSSLSVGLSVCVRLSVCNISVSVCQNQAVIANCMIATCLGGRKWPSVWPDTMMSVMSPDNLSAQNWVLRSAGRLVPSPGQKSPLTSDVVCGVPTLASTGSCHLFSGDDAASVLCYWHSETDQHVKGLLKMTFDMTSGSRNSNSHRV